MEYVAADVVFLCCRSVCDPSSRQVSNMQKQNVSRIFDRGKTLYHCSLLQNLQDLRQNRSRTLRNDMFSDYIFTMDCSKKSSGTMLISHCSYSLNVGIIRKNGCCCKSVVPELLSAGSWNLTATRRCFPNRFGLFLCRMGKNL